ncbi:MAG: TRAP transporter small permease [Clostridia bacterium]|nr:TRAP transporter small permease [Clostridia bacterium]
MSIISVLKKISDILEKVAEVLTGILIIFLTILIFVSVVARFVFNSPVQWQYEATLVCMSWTVFVGMSMTFKQKEHMALTFVTNALPPKAKAIWMSALDVIVMAFLVIAIIEGIAVTSSTMPLKYMTIPVSRGVFYMAFPVGAAFSLVHLLLHLLTRRTKDFLPEALEVE